MNRIRLAILLAGSLAAVSLAHADTLLFTGTNSDLGATHTYVLDGINIVASGFLSTSNPTDLYGKNQGGSEKGVGLNADPSGDHEIWYRSATLGSQDFIQLNLTNLINAGFTNFKFEMGSTTQGETWTVSACGTAGVLCHNASSVSGTGQMTFNLAPGNLSAVSPYLDFYSSAFVNPNTGSASNVLLDALSATSVVPEPSYGLLLMGLLATVVFVRRRASSAA